MSTTFSAQLSDSFIIYGFSLRLSFVCGLPAPIQLASWSRGMEVGLETCFIHSTHLADGDSIVLGQPAVAWCPELTASQVNNAGSKKYMKCFSQSRL
jgi:hypothetical protein